MGLDRGEGVMTRLEDSGAPREDGTGEVLPEAREEAESRWVCLVVSKAGFVRGAVIRTEDGRADPAEEALPALPCRSWPWLELGRLPCRLELDIGRTSWEGVLTKGELAAGAVGWIGVGETLWAFTSSPLRLRLL